MDGFTWNTLFKIDDLRVPLFLETPIYVQPMTVNKPFTWLSPFENSLPGGPPMFCAPFSPFFLPAFFLVRQKHKQPILPIGSVYGITYIYVGMYICKKKIYTYIYI